MIAILKWIIVSIYNILPDSPFAQMVDNLELQQDFLQYLNWFLPIDIMGNMLLAWLDCMLLYAVFRLVWKIINIIKNLLFSAIGMLFKLFIPIG